MPEISTCPKCQRQVSIPHGVDSAALVRCPLCDAEYSLVQALPPELIPVVVPVEEAETYPLAETPVAEQAGEDVAEEENEAAAVVGRMPLGVTRVRKRPSKPWWQTLIEVVTGGVAGCLLAYYGLAFWLGPEFNLPKYSFLPFITQWTAPPEKADGVGEKPPAEKPAAEKPVKPKPDDKKAAPKAPDGPKEPPKGPPKASPPPSGVGKK